MMSLTFSSIDFSAIKIPSSFGFDALLRAHLFFGKLFLYVKARRRNSRRGQLPK
jgi:hypothetical protein